MPGVKNTTKPQSRYAKAANSKNQKAVELALSGEGNFARVEKSLGNRQFHVRFYDNDKKQTLDLLAIPRGVFSAGGKARVIISVGDIVLLDGIVKDKDTATRILEITGRLDKKQAQELYKAGRIHQSIYTTEVKAQDEIFDYSEDLDDLDDLDIEVI